MGMGAQLKFRCVIEGGTGKGMGKKANAGIMLTLLLVGALALMFDVDLLGLVGLFILGMMVQLILLRCRFSVTETYTPLPTFLRECFDKN